MAVLVYRPNHPNANANGLVEKSLLSPTSDDPKIYVISDTMPETRHMADGKYYSSKSKFREVTKAHGCIEMGNDSSLTRPRKSIPLSREKRRDDIRRTIYELRNGRG